jgi:predicted small secreted protein
LIRRGEEAATVTSRVRPSRTGAKAAAPSPSRLLSVAALFLAAFMVLSGCNTLEGMGEDAEVVGDEVDEEL